MQVNLEAIRSFIESYTEKYAEYANDYVPWQDGYAARSICINCDMLEKNAEEELRINFDELDDDWEFTTVCKEDEPLAWELQKQFIINNLKNL